MDNYNLFPFLEEISNMDIVTSELFEEIMNDYELSTSDFENMKNNEQEQLRISGIMGEKFFYKEKKEFHTISSKHDFSELITKNHNEGNPSIFTLVYSPLNDHSRDKLGIGDILFSYRTGQFNNLNEALNTRGIYGMGIAITNPMKFTHEYTSGNHGEYKDYGVIVAYPFLLENHLSVRSIQLHPNTIDLTPYNGNRNDALQHIGLPKHYNTLLSMIAYQNPDIIEFFDYLKLDIKPSPIPDDFWKTSLPEEKKFLTNTNYKALFTNWLPTVVTDKSASNYISGLNTLERVWNENNPEEKISIWEDPYDLKDILGYEYIFNHDEIKTLSTQQNNTQSAALRHYFTFLDKLKTDSTLPAKNNTHLVSIGINKIYFGAPGTGKSFGIKKFIQENGIENFDEKVDHSNVFRATLHPEFTYNDFVGQVMPVVLRGNSNAEPSRIEYQFSPQIFTKALKRAFDVENTEPVFLILEEMSRANVAAVFGDLFQLLDRDENGESEYMIDNLLVSQELWGTNSTKKIYIPKNLFIIGTVNTSDQNVFVMDTAFKRRFEFDYVNANSIAKDNNGNYLNNFIFELKDTITNKMYKFSWIDLYSGLNKFITTKSEKGGLGLPEDKQLGQFFIKFKDTDPTYNYNQFKGKLLQYLWHDIQNTAYTDNSLFQKNINNFSDAFTEISTGHNIFSEAFLKFLKFEVSQPVLTSPLNENSEI